MSAQVAADLRAAADVLERDGWTQGKFFDATSGCRCAAGAIIAAIDQEATSDSWPPDDPAWHRYGAALTELDQWVTIPGWNSVADWNDEPSRTAAEVIAALRFAADEAEAAR